MTETILVTGGAGYIGSHCCKFLESAGYRPVVYDDLSTGHREFIKWGPFVEGDIRDRQRLVDALSRYRPALVMHFANPALAGSLLGWETRRSAIETTISDAWEWHRACFDGAQSAPAISL